ncbi:arginine repressor [Pseudoalteromonas piratica]|uniref:Arginine repressor n=1 Tax=Pseudoalteromonas piratica TaxID=1348114 RepID=A0A0A7EIH3_9GAMM|nr:hypothetical protein [Pseudoalteromonas piratica]AIY66434.1 hypothetical protein OM33_14815 [Pseudoalteromonas piratica]AIY67632.1 hypothetical protein OM33_21865 [Pseudoalteromonas piratica]
MEAEKSLNQIIKHLILQKEIRSQFELSYELGLMGFADISQSRISRMLTRLGAVRMRNSNHQLVYRLPSDVGMPGLKQSIESVVLACDKNEALVVIKTQAGGAKIVARVLDHLHDSLGISGTVASDDTLFIMPKPAQCTTLLCNQICDILDFYQAA